MSWPRIECRRWHQWIWTGYHRRTDWEQQKIQSKPLTSLKERQVKSIFKWHPVSQTANLLWGRLDFREIENCKNMHTWMDASKTFGDNACRQFQKIEKEFLYKSATWWHFFKGLKRAQKAWNAGWIWESFKTRHEQPRKPAYIAWMNFFDAKNSATSWRGNSKATVIESMCRWENNSSDARWQLNR